MDNEPFTTHGEVFAIELETIENKIYGGLVFYNEKGSDKCELLMSSLIEIIHKILVDKDRTERVTELEFERKQDYLLDSNRTYYYLVNQKAFDKTKSPYKELDIKDMYAPMAKSDFFNSHWDLLVKTNKLAHLSSIEKKLVEKYRKTWFNSTNIFEYLAHIPRLIITSSYALYVDNRSDEAMTSYIEDLSLIYNMKFTDIYRKYDDEKKQENISFTYKGKQYSSIIEDNEERVQERIIQLVHKAIRENKVAGQIYSLNKRKEYDLIFLTPSQANEFRKSKLFELYPF